MQAPIIEQVGKVLVVRDDLLAGGTKVRALPVLFDDRYEEYVYASPVYGYAQIALAMACRDEGFKATIVCAKREQKHQRTLEAEAAGATILEITPGYMSVLRARAREYCSAHHAKLMPFGLDDIRIIEELSRIAAALPVKPTEVWSVAGSGVLTRALQLAWPEVQAYAVRVGAMPNPGRAFLYTAPEEFEDDASEPPPFPSCSNYDAKAWQFIRRHASDGALFWNVAK